MKANEKVHYIASTTFTLNKKYSDLKPIGKGSYGVVCKATNNETKRQVAIKKITPMSKTIEDAKHVLREVRLMRHLGNHENIVTLVNLIVRDSADELYIIMELLDSDLHRVLQSSQALSENHFRYFMYQLLNGIQYMHKYRIIHRDLKPGNLLISKDCQLRITDFGLARERPTGIGENRDEDIQSPMTEHVVTRWYRAPELMLCPDGFYDYSVDMWSAGCILAEMLGRKPLFPGKNFVHQLSLIFDVIGIPTRNEVMHIKNSQAKKFLSSQKDKKKVDFSFIFPNASSDFHEILDHILQFDPKNRIDCNEIFKHPFITKMNYPVVKQPNMSPEFEFLFETMDLSISQMKLLINQESIKIQKKAHFAYKEQFEFSGREKEEIVSEWKAVDSEGNYGSQAVHTRNVSNEGDSESELTQPSELSGDSTRDKYHRESTSRTNIKPHVSNSINKPASSTAVQKAGQHGNSTHSSGKYNSTALNNKTSTTGNRPSSASATTGRVLEKKENPLSNPKAVPSRVSTNQFSAHSNTANARVRANSAPRNRPNSNNKQERNTNTVHNKLTSAHDCEKNASKVDLQTVARNEAIQSLEQHEAIQKSLNVLSPARRSQVPDPESESPDTFKKVNEPHHPYERVSSSVLEDDEEDEMIANIMNSNNQMLRDLKYGNVNNGVEMGHILDNLPMHSVGTMGTGTGGIGMGPKEKATRPVSAYMYKQRAKVNTNAHELYSDNEHEVNLMESETGSEEEEAPVMPHVIQERPPYSSNAVRSATDAILNANAVMRSNNGMDNNKGISAPDGVEMHSKRVAGGTGSGFSEDIMRKIKRQTQEYATERAYASRRPVSANASTRTDRNESRISRPGMIMGGALEDDETQCSDVEPQQDSDMQAHTQSRGDTGHNRIAGGNTGTRTRPYSANYARTTSATAVQPQSQVHHQAQHDPNPYSKENAHQANKHEQTLNRNPYSKKSNQKKLTVPKSPNFSRMSHQKRRGSTGATTVANTTGVPRNQPPPLPISLTQMGMTMNTNNNISHSKVVSARGIAGERKGNNVHTNTNINLNPNSKRHAYEYGATLSDDDDRHDGQSNLIHQHKHMITKTYQQEDNEKRHYQQQRMNQLSNTGNINGSSSGSRSKSNGRGRNAFR